MWLTNTQLIEPELYSPSIFDNQQSVMCIAYVSCIKKKCTGLLDESSGHDDGA